jgi:uncharacterized protein YndB with AHSA1/START domain
MSQRPVTFDTFTIERVLDAPPARVFEALANPEIKAKWFAGSPWELHERTQDFRVGGRDRTSGTHPGGTTSVFEAQYLDIVPGERVVYVYEMTVNGKKLSASLATFQITPVGNRTRLALTEQGAYFAPPELDALAPGGHAASRLKGTEELMNRLASLFAS